MKKFIKKIKSNKFLYILSVLIIGVFLALIFRVTYAFLAPIINEAQSNIAIKGDTVDDFDLKVGSALKLDVTPTILKENGTNYTTSTTATASLKANSTKNTATYNYYLYFQLENNTFTYTDGSTPEIILTITNPNGEEVTSIEGLTYGTFNGVSGFDVTTQNGLFKIVNNYSITSNSSTTFTNQVWNITLTYLNLPIDQSSNFGKSMSANVMIQKNKLPEIVSDVCSGGENLATCITTLAGKNPASLTKIYHHDASLTNGAGDNSYRFAGASPNNYVCFGTNTTPCPTDNLYRIIGVFGDQVKLIKYDYANSNLLGTDGDYSTDTYSKSSNSTYKGELTTINRYYWNDSTKKNTWSESELNKTNLNTNFITNIGTEWAEKIAKTTWKVGGNTYANIVTSPMYTAYQNEITNAVTTNTTDGKTEYSAKIGLMYVSDYGYAASPTYWTYSGYNSDETKDYRAATTSNWMYMGLYDWTISRSAGDSSGVFRVDNLGYVSSGNVFGRSGVRPSFNLESAITYVSGSGSANDPIVVN